MSWDKDIKKLEKYFSAAEMPIHPLRLNEASWITNVSKFVKSHLDIVKANSGNKTYKPYLDRLKELKKLLENN